MGEGGGQSFHLEAGGRLVALAESPFALEDHLETLIADYPELIPGDQVDPESPRCWLLVGQQFAIPGDATSWALDLLLVDQDGIPTFHELKKGSNRELRREGVDYAANTPIFWSPGSLLSAFEARCGASQADPAALLANRLQVASTPEDFWSLVDQNLKARKIRLLFVTDRMVPELRRVVEFLNQSMAVVKVLAIEIRRFTGAGPSTLVPTVYGQTLASEEKKSSGSVLGPGWTAESFLVELENRKRADVREVAAPVAWGEAKAEKVWRGLGSTAAGFRNGVVATIGLDGRGT